MKYILDVQGYWIERVFIVKKIYYYCVENKNAVSYLFRPIVPFNLLSEKHKNIVIYYEKYIHKLQWSFGRIDYNELSYIITQIKPDDTVYVLKRFQVDSVKYLLGENVDLRLINPTQIRIS